MHIYKHTYVLSNIYTDIITHTCIRHIVGMHTCTRPHDYAHVHAIVNLQLKFSTHVCKSTCEQPNAHGHACLSAHMYTHTHMHALPPSHIPYACSLVMSHLTIYLQVTINSFHAWVLVHIEIKQIIRLSKMHKKHSQNQNNGGENYLNICLYINQLGNAQAKTIQIELKA